MEELKKVRNVSAKDIDWKKEPSISTMAFHPEISSADIYR
jgi:hypothetical protein